MNNSKQPYFYILQHKTSKIKYSGCKYAKNSDSSNLLTENGYKTSSNVIKKIINIEGILSFKILKIVHESEMDNSLTAWEYETRFLIDHDCKNSTEWFNKHDNTNLLSIGTKKFKKVMFEKYGTETPQSLPFVNEKREGSMLARYGNKNASNVKKFVEKRKQTHKKNWENGHASRHKETQEKVANTCMKKYGIDHHLKAKEVIEKRKKTYSENYGIGVENYSQTPDGRKNASKTAKRERANDPLLTCPHCSKVIKGKLNYTRWHGDSCKYRTT